MDTEIRVISHKFGGQVKRSWKCEVVEASDTHLICFGVFDADVKHDRLGLISKGTRSREYYWLDRWYNVFEFEEPAGGLRNFYCNISMPPTFGNDLLEYTDLEIDVVVWPDGQIEILDRDEFEVVCSVNRFSKEIMEKVESTLDELLSSIGRRDVPFDILSTQ